MTWLSSDPAPVPPEPEDVDLLREYGEAEEKGSASLALSYFREHAPKLPTDMWGLPLPISRVDQDRANRLWALLVSPLHRGRALMRSGAILKDEAAVLHEVYPDIWLLLDDELRMAMVTGRPPFPAWAEALIGTWFNLPPKVAFAKAQDQAKGGGKKASKAGDTALPTPADRRELAVRER